MSADDPKASELVATAATTAFDLTAKAADAAKEVVATAAKEAATARVEEKEDDDRVTRALANALRRVFGENEKSGRFIDTSRIPLICAHIESMDANIKDIKEKLDTRYVTVEAFSPYKKAMNAIAALILVAVVGGLLSLIFIRT